MTRTGRPPLVPDDDRTAITISMPLRAASQLDALARSSGCNRSELVRRALISYAKGLTQDERRRIDLDIAGR